MHKAQVEKPRLRRLLTRLSGARVLVVGDLMLDQFIRGSVSRISPEAPVPVVHVRAESLMPGGAGNVALNLASLGARADLVGIIGDDPAGRTLLDTLCAQGIDTSRVLVDPERVTSQKCRVIAEHQQVVRYDRETPRQVSASGQDDLCHGLKEALVRAQAVIISDYGKGVVSPSMLKAIMAAARARSIPVVVDPKIDNFGLYRGVDCITPNTAEAWAGMRRVPKPGQEPLDVLGWDILKRLKARSVLITRGPEGMSLFESGGCLTHIPTRAREVYDVTGAGDTVVSVLALARACRASIRDAAALANYAAGIVVGKLGTATASVAELREVLR
jgi:D-beta-D-heptose 7-phosphate kinase/D-beta-D-heptose 1-phosphate adenosyltransferase